MIFITFELNSFAVNLHSRIFKFPKMVQQQIWGGVVDFIPACC